MNIKAIFLVLCIVLCSFTTNAVYSLKHNMKNYKGKVSEALKKEADDLTTSSKSFVSTEQKGRTSKSSYPSYGSSSARNSG